MEEITLKVIAHIYNDYSAKFGVPRQSGLVQNVSKIVFEPEYRKEGIVNCLDAFSHLWLIWGFSELFDRHDWSPTVRPPRLGGNKRVGVFASRSPFRPNPLALSCVKLDRIEKTQKEGVVLYVIGADMMSGTPIYDIKPYQPNADSHPDALGGFSDRFVGYCVDVDIPEELLEKVPQEKRQVLRDMLGQDPRPAYQDDPNRVYGMEYAGMNVKFQMKNGALTVIEIEKMR